MLGNKVRLHKIPHCLLMILLACWFVICSTGCGGGSYGTQLGDDVTVRGYVKDSEGNPLAEVSVQSVTTDDKTFTDSSGSFSIKTRPIKGAASVELLFNNNNIAAPFAPGFITEVEVRKRTGSTFELVSADPVEEKKEPEASDPVSDDRSGFDSDNDGSKPSEGCNRECQDQRRKNAGGDAGDDSDTPNPDIPTIDPELAEKCNPVIYKYLQTKDLQVFRGNDGCYRYYLRYKSRFDSLN
jgi:hypothetical protein